MRALPPEADEHFGVFRVDQAIRAGWTPSALRHAERTGVLERLRRGVYALPMSASGQQFDDAAVRLRRRAAALALTQHRIVLSHAAAATFDELPLVRVPLDLCVTSSRPLRGKVGDARLHRGSLPRSHVAQHGLITYTSAARTVVDLAREHGAVSAIAAADTALGRGLTSSAGLAAVIRHCSGWPGVVAARRVVALADGRSESALESVSRLRMDEFALPAPALQVPIYSGGGFLGRPDFYWDEFGVIGEADGMAKYDGRPLSLREEKRRQGELEDAGLITVRWGWTDAWAFDAVAARLSAAFARGLRPDRAPRLWTTACHLGSAVS